jgi:hypothetical protein
MDLGLPFFGVTFAAFFVWLTVRIVNRRERWATLIAAVAVWDAICLGVFTLLPRMIGPVVVALYTRFCGDIQASYGTFERLSHYLLLIVSTAMASAFTLWFFESFTRRRTKWRRRAFVFSTWEAAVVALLICSYEVGFPAKIHELDWALFGPPENIWGFRNLVAHRVIAWFICTTPIAAAAILRHGSDYSGPGLTIHR